ncbi:MAG: Tex family protein [Cyclobacteriaceae bacterium]
MAKHIFRIATELNIKDSQVKTVIELLDEGATVPFISRYRKERTGSLDEVVVAAIRDRVNQLRDLDKRRESILKSIDDQGKLTPDLKAKLDAAITMAELEDIYLPYKPKKRTKATIAREKGLEPLAATIMDQRYVSLSMMASKFIDVEKGVHTVEDALQGARDIIAEWVNENQEVRKRLRTLFTKKGVISAKVLKGKEEEGQKYKDYFDYSEEIAKVPSHRMLALRRGEKELILSLDISPEEADALNILEKQFVKGSSDSAEQVSIACKDSYKRLLKPSMETEIRLLTKGKADDEAIKVFADNLRQLLLAAPLGQKRVLGIDPGFRTGCKVVCLDSQGKLLHNEAIFPNEPQKDIKGSGEVIRNLVKQFSIEAVAIGNGTASRETEQFVKGLALGSNVIIAMINESGASIYSASEIARNEFPNHDITVRGAVSIGRRMMDPLAELVKIDPKSIGVGQYQHDVDQTALKNSLDDTVMSCVNSVGIELNTASKELLTYVSGLGPQLAQNIVEHRNENGAFSSKKDLQKVARLGAKAFEQAAGFLRIGNAKNILDRSAVHPERFSLVKKIAGDLNCKVDDLTTKPDLRERVDLNKYVDEEVGLPTLKDIMDELAKPGRDPRDQFEVVNFQDGVNSMEDLKVGMKLPGIITNVTKFGAFVDIGVHQDGLIHISQLADRFVNDPAQVVKLNQKVDVTVTEVDINRKRIALSMKADPFGKKSPSNSIKKDKRQTGGAMDDKLRALKGRFRNH